MSTIFKVGLTALMVAVQLTFSGITHAQENLDTQTILAAAKIAGACGIMDEMVNFQKKTKLPGGNVFVTRFWHAESARRGMTVKEVSDQCNGAITLYGRLWDSAGGDKQ